MTGAGDRSTHLCHFVLLKVLEVACEQTKLMEQIDNCCFEAAVMMVVRLVRLVVSAQLGGPIMNRVIAVCAHHAPSQHVDPVCSYSEVAVEMGSRVDVQCLCASVHAHV